MQAETGGERFFDAELYRLRAQLLAVSGRGGEPEIEDALRRGLAAARAQEAASLERRIFQSIERL